MLLAQGSSLILILAGIFWILIKKGVIKFRAQGESTINIDVSQTQGELKDEIFGSGLKGISPVFFKPGFKVALKNMGLKLLRIHADPFLEGGFTRAIGPIENRVVIDQTNEGYDRYPSGPDEWGQTAKEIGAELSITFPYGDGSLKYKNQFRNLVEYMNDDEITLSLGLTATEQNFVYRLAPGVSNFTLPLANDWQFRLLAEPVPEPSTWFGLLLFCLSAVPVLRRRAFSLSDNFESHIKSLRFAAGRTNFWHFSTFVDIAAI